MADEAESRRRSAARRDRTRSKARADAEAEAKRRADAEAARARAEEAAHKRNRPERTRSAWSRKRWRGPDGRKRRGPKEVKRKKRRKPKRWRSSRFWPPRRDKAAGWAAQSENLRRRAEKEKAECRRALSGGWTRFGHAPICTRTDRRCRTCCSAAAVTEPFARSSGAAAKVSGNRAGVSRLASSVEGRTRQRRQRSIRSGCVGASRRVVPRLFREQDGFPRVRSRLAEPARPAHPVERYGGRQAAEPAG